MQQCIFIGNEGDPVREGLLSLMMGAEADESPNPNRNEQYT